MNIFIIIASIILFAFTVVSAANVALVFYCLRTFVNCLIDGDNDHFEKAIDQ